MNLTSQQRTALSGLLKALFFSALLALVIFILTSCTKSADIPQATAKVYTADEVRSSVPGAICGDTAYAEVNSVWLRGYYDQFRAEIFRQGVTKWDDRFDCNHFASYYVALAQTKFYLSNFHSSTKARSLAVGSYWYNSPRGPHAVVFALTEQGIVFIEPQTGKEVPMGVNEQMSAFLKIL